MGSNTWDIILAEIELDLSAASYKTWFKNTHLLSWDDNVLRVAVPNVFTKNQMEHKFKQQIEAIAKSHNSDFKDVEFIIDTTRSQSISNNVEKETTKRRKKPPTQLTNTQPSCINPKYTFENYIVGASNEIAYTACLAAAKDPGSRYNPLFIYGGVGLGKTHLIQAVGNKILSDNPKAKVIYTSSEAFIRDFVKSIRNKQPFTNSYRQADVLIVDDIQFIGSAEKTQEEFFHTFNELHQHNKQIIISSDKQPKAIPTLADRLQSRFEWGITIDIQQPDYETRCAILQAKGAASGVDLPQETVEYLAANIQTNIRELEGSLNQLVAFCDVRGLKPTLDTTKTLLANARVRPKHISATDIVKKTAKYFSVDEELIKSPRRDRDIVVPRQIAMYLLRSELHLSFPKIAKELGRKDHTTAIHSIDKIEGSINIDGRLRQNINNIKDVLYA